MTTSDWRPLEGGHGPQADFWPASLRFGPGHNFRLARHPASTWSRTFRPTYGHSFGRAQSRVAFVAGQPTLDYKFAAKANRRHIAIACIAGRKHKFTKRTRIEVSRG